MALVTLPAEPPMHDHLFAGQGVPLFTAATGAAAIASRAADLIAQVPAPGPVARAIQATLPAIFAVCTVGGFIYSTINMLANWPETRAKFRRNREARRSARKSRIMDRYPGEPRR